MTTVVVEYKKRYYLLTGRYRPNSLLHSFLLRTIRHRPSHAVLFDAVYNARRRGFPVWKTSISDVKKNTA